MLFRIDHETKLSYSDHIIESVIEVRMSPPSSEDQTLLGYKLKISPQVPTTTYQDGFGNRTDLFNVQIPHKEVIIKSGSCVQCHRRSGTERLLQIPWPNMEPLDLVGVEYIRPSPMTKPSAELLSFCESLPKVKGTMKDVVDMLMQQIRSKLEYVKKATTFQTSMAEAMKLGKGVCQDFAHVFIGTSRQLGIPTRYVSGYIHQPGEIATHAWCQVWGGEACGWVDVDPTRNIWVGNDHIVTAVGRDFSDIPPNRGVWKGATVDETISVTVSVQQVDRLPNDLTDPTTPAWSNTIIGEGLANQAKPLLPQQYRRQHFRQQQSQQQQSQQQDGRA